MARGSQEQTRAFTVAGSQLGGKHSARKAELVSRRVVDVSSERSGAFEDALTRIGVGERILYHVGEYCAGAHRVAARSAYDGGLVTLTLRKLSKNSFEYIAVKIAERS